MAYDGTIFAGSLADINVAAAGALAVLNPMLAQLDFTLFGAFGVASIQADIAFQIQAALRAQLDIGLGIANPFAGFTAALAGIVALQAQIQLALSGAIPALSLDAIAQISALASLQLSLGAQLGGLEAIIQAGVAVKLPAASFSGGLGLNLSAGPVFVLSFSDIPLAAAGSNLAADFAGGLLQGSSFINPGDAVYGLVLVTKAPAAWAAMQATLRTA